MFAFALPRGTGKTRLCIWGMIFSVFGGYCPYSLYVGATAAASDRRFGELKKTLRFNQLLFDDFPEICGPFRHIGGEPRKATGQKWEGRSTGVEWSDRIVVADIPVAYAKSRNFVFDTASIDGEIRGRSFETQDGETIRPRFVVCDDPQTRETARSPGANDYRELIIKGDIKYLAGPGEKLGLVIPGTVIYQNDLIDRLLDPKRNPEFKPVRAKMLESLPEDVELWDQYAEIRKQSFRDGGKGEPATEFYRKQREKMDRGAVASWPERFRDDEISAIQYAMNLKIDDEASFYAEGQSEPIPETAGDERPLTATDVEGRELSIAWGYIPDDAEKITGFVDISERVLWYCLIAWKRDGTGTVFEYGLWPDQKLNYVTLAGVRKTIQQQAKGESYLSALLLALESLVELLVGREYTSESGEILSIGALGIDSGWGEYAHDVYKFCRRSKYRALLRPTKGIGITATKRPLVDPQHKTKTRESVEGQWLFSPTKIGVPLLQYDTNLWKSRIVSAFRIDRNSPGALCLTKPRPGGSHRMIGEQVTAEYGTRVTANGRTVTQFALIPGRDNHFGDCLVGSAVVANTIGVRFDLGFFARIRAKKKDGDKAESKPSGEKSKGAATPARSRPRPQSEVIF